MTESEVSAKVLRDLDGRKTNKFGWDIAKHLASPAIIEHFQDMNGNSWPKWVVLREPGNGYVVALDPEDGSYSLCFSGMLLSRYGSLIQLLDSM